METDADKSRSVRTQDGGAESNQKIDVKDEVSTPTEVKPTESSGSANVQLEEPPIPVEAAEGVLSKPVELQMLKETPPLIDEPARSTADSRRSWTTVAVVVLIVIIVLGGFLLYVKWTAKDIKTVCFGDRCIKGIPQDKIEFNGYPFYKFQDLWFTQIERGNIQVNTQFHFSPPEVKDIPITGNLNATFDNSPVIYVSHDLSAEVLNVTALATGELQLNLAQAFNLPLESACMNADVPECEVIPVITCDTVSNATVIEVVEMSPTKVSFDGNCIRLQGEDLELVRAIDRVLYRWYGIMK